MSAVDAVARIGTADLGNEANDYRGHIREWISANGPAGRAAMIRWNAESYGSPERARALASPEYVEPPRSQPLAQSGLWHCITAELLLTYKRAAVRAGSQA
jgi:hypothetical protein